MGSTADFRGKWALVTGASAGIGVAIAKELARNGAKLILTARRQERLEALAAELTTQGTEVRVILADLTDPSAPQTIYDAIQAGGLQVDILVNNAGLGQYGDFYETDMVQELNQIRVNCEAVVHLTRLFVPKMVERHRGWILVVASTASFQPVPFLSTYAATKVFDRFFAQGLAEELSPYGVKVTALCPGPTESEFFEVAGAAKFRNRKIQSAEEVARLGLQALATGKRKIIPYFGGRATAFAVRFLPVGWITYIVARVARPKKA
jgi:short-subunit dehydrogenase